MKKIRILDSERTRKSMPELIGRDVDFFDLIKESRQIVYTNSGKDIHSQSLFCYGDDKDFEIVESASENKMNLTETLNQLKGLIG